MSSKMRELTDGELDSVGGGHHHHHRHHGSWTGGGSTGFLGTSPGHDLTLNLYIIFINIDNIVGAEIGQQANGSVGVNGIGASLGSLGL